MAKRFHFAKDRLIVTVNEAAFMLHVGKSNEWFKERMNLGELKVVNIAGRVYITRKSIDELLASMEEVRPVKIKKAGLDEEYIKKRLSEFKNETLYKQRA